MTRLRSALGALLLLAVAAVGGHDAACVGAPDVDGPTRTAAGFVAPAPTLVEATAARPNDGGLLRARSIVAVALLLLVAALVRPATVEVRRTSVRPVPGRRGGGAVLRGPPTSS
ncbi:MAG: hypothetical protein ACRD12_14915 [Acidimicrobiales bacterium]